MAGIDRSIETRDLRVELEVRFPKEKCRTACFFLLTSALFSISVTTDAGASNATFVLEEVDGAPEHTYRLLYVPDANALFVTTRNGTVHKFDGARWQLALDTKRNLICFPNSDSQGNIYISTWNRLYRSSDHGNTWSLVFSYPWCRIWHIADLRNGTLIGDNWVSPQGPYLWRSDNWGKDWYLWKNFTRMFPQYAKQSPRHEEGSYLLRHLHYVAYDNYTGNIIASAGDDVRLLFTTSDGKTWEETECEAYTGMMVLEDRILYGPDHNYGLTIYDRKTDTYRVLYRKFGTEDIDIIRIDDFVYDIKTGIVYAGVIAARAQDHYGIICSLDRGETWNTLYRKEATIGKYPSVVWLSLFDGYLYVSMGYEPEARLYRAPLVLPLECHSVDSQANDVQAHIKLLNQTHGSIDLVESDTDQSGRCTFLLQQTGTYTLKTIFQGTQVNSTTITLTTRERVTVILQCQIYNLTVSIKDQHSKALPKAEVTVKWPNGTAIRTLQTNEDGLATFHKIPIGSYTATATHQQLSASQRIDLKEDVLISMRIAVPQSSTSRFIEVLLVIITLTVMYVIYRHTRSRVKKKL